MIPLIPICYYPHRKIILDDDQAFTQSMLLKLAGKNFTSCNSPIDILNNLSHYKPELNKNDLLINNSFIADTSTQHIINIDIKKFSKLLSRTDFNDISVLLVDYHMPEMTGIEFLQQISHLPIKKALITGENDYKIAVDSFNSGLIDAYLRKDDPQFSSKITKIASELEWKYFTELSSLIFEIPEFNFLKNLHLYTVFKQYIEEKNISAFCLADLHGTFITQNQNGDREYLFIRSKNQLEVLTQVAGEDGASQEVINQLINTNVIPFFDSKEYWEIPASEWDDYLCPIKKIAGETELFWATKKI